MSIKVSVIIGVGIGLVGIVAFTTIFWAEEKFKQMEASSVETACLEHYRDKVLKGKPIEFTVSGSHDSEPKDGYGSCDIYDAEGKIIARLECDSSLLFNSGNCKTAKYKM